MPVLEFPKRAWFGFVLFACPFLAAAQTTSSSTPELIMTSGIVGVATTQSVRLNVLNLQPVTPGVTVIACPATLEFYDDTGALLKQMSVTNIAPATAANLVFKPTVPSTATRVQLRAVVVTPFPTVTPVANPGSTIVVPAAPACSLMSSLEVTDDATADTHSFTTDFRAMTGYILGVVPPSMK